jgi:hypothetical protein
MDDVLTLPGCPDDEPGAPDVEPTFGSVTECEGRYEVDPIAGGKRFQGAWLILDDGTRYVLSYRPIPAQFAYVDKRVRVTGRPYTPGRDTQHMMAAHFQLDTIELAPGEEPYAEVPVRLPAPPMLHTMDEICKHAGRWAQIITRLVSLEDDPDTYFSKANLELEDGTLVVALYAAEKLWEPYLGNTITVVSRIEVQPSKAVSNGNKCPAVLTGWYALCRGQVERCGM